MRSSWSVRVLLPAARSMAEGSWLAVLYAALQAGGREVAYLGPLELGALVIAGTAWGRRRRWTSPTVEALGLPLLALLSGVFGWMLSPDVRLALVEGDLLRALSLHLPGWLSGAERRTASARTTRSPSTGWRDGPCLDWPSHGCSATHSPTDSCRTPSPLRRWSARSSSSARRSRRLA